MIDLITGGSGFFGTNLALFLLSKGRKVRIYDLVEPVPELKDKVEFIKGDILDLVKLAKLFKDIDTVYHTVALVPLSKAGERFMQVNMSGTLNVATLCACFKTRKLIHISSSAVYDLNEMPITEESPIKPLGDYGNTKYSAEFIAKQYNINYTIIRPRTILGPYRAGVFQILFDWIYRGKTIPIVGDGKNLFQLISARDLAEACFLASKSKKATRQVINIGNEKFGTINELIEGLINYAGSGSKIRHVNATLSKFILRLLDKLHISPLADWHYMTLDKPFWFDISKAKKLLNWKPKDSNNDMIRESWNWWMDHRNLPSGTTHRTAPKQGILKWLR